MGRVPLLVAAVLAVATFGVGVGVGVARNPGDPPGADPSLRTGEVAGPRGAARSGPLAFRVLAWRCGILAVVGDHADWLPDGQYCRVRVRMENRDRPPTSFAAASQQLVDTAGTAHPTDVDATQIADQPTSIAVSAFGAYEFDLWFDIPEGARPRAVRFASPDGPGAEVRLG